jgi:hypothetical protein
MLMIAVMMMAGSDTSAHPQQARQDVGEVAFAWASLHAAPDTEAANDPGSSKPNTAPPSVSVDDERSELGVMHGLSVPALLTNAHPPLASALDPADNWPGLPLRPPKH